MKAILLLSLFMSSVAFAFTDTTTGAVNFLSLTKRLDAYGSLSFYHYDVYSFDEDDPTVIQSYFQTAYNYQVLPALALSLGYIFQRSDPFEGDAVNEHRSFLQVTALKHLISHRFRFEERFVGSSPLRTRLRYQIGAKIPLRGLILDAGEYYINTYNEFYFSTTGERNAFFSDDWFYFGSGIKTQEYGSFELGPLLMWSEIDRQKDTRIRVNLQVGWSYTF